MQKNKYQQAVNLLTSNEHFYVNLGLDRIKKVLELSDNPQDKLKYIHVAGTNGKGSVCAILNEILQNNGLKTGLYTSPHIFEYTERIRINGKCIGKNDFANLICEIVNVAKKNKILLTEFEILTVAAFLYFARNNADVVVLETGLGGRFDATNVIKDNLCSIITHIDLEHTDRLGDSIEKISFEKAGIIKPHCPVVIGEKNEVIKNIAKEKSSKVFLAEPTDKKCSLTNVCQEANLALALKASSVLGYEVKDEVLMSVKNPCRFEYLKDYNVIVDVAHNPNGIEALRKSLDKIYPKQHFNFIFGCLRTKDYESMLKSLLKDEDKIYVYEFNHPQSCKYTDLQEIIKHPLLRFSQYKKDENLTVICGSFYMLKELFSDMGIKYDTDSNLS
ncbi:bifunctional folylpolyglutamate synthase/dihydrofolate synthase [bacterium]|nr:bifunctional folylpolyglutamate synthase/dihydrofolate synthase [bacterium]